MDGLSDSVWNRGGADTIPERLFYLLFMAFTVAGLGVTAYIAGLTEVWVEVVPGAGEDGESLYLWHGPVPHWMLLIGILVISIAGVFIALSSGNWLVSLVGYALVAGPFGALVGPFVAMYTEASVSKAVYLTGMVTAGMGLIGFIYPKSLQSWAGWLLGALLVLIVGQFGVLIAGVFGLPIEGAMTFLDWVGVILFSAYIIFDVNRAKFVPRTLDNAVDCALALYLDIINLFLRLLAIFGTKK